MANDLDLLSADISNYIVAPLNAFGIGGFVFDSDGESIAELHADVTDHFTEDNRAIQDHVAIKPKKITLKGYVGEVLYSTNPADQSFIQQAVQKLTTVSAFLPVLSASATQIQEILSSPAPLQSAGNFSIADTSNIYALVKNIIGSFGSQARQQNAYLYFKALMTSKILMGVQTPWEFIPNMLIESIHAIQSEASIFVTDFSVTLKEMRFAQTASLAYNATLQGQNSQPQSSSQATQTNMLGYTGNYPQVQSVETQTLDGAPVLQGAAVIQSPDPVPIGNVQGVSLPSSSLPGLQGQMTGVGGILPPIPQVSTNNLSDLPVKPSLSSVFIPFPPPLTTSP